MLTFPSGARGPALPPAELQTAQQAVMMSSRGAKPLDGAYSPMQPMVHTNMEGMVIPTNDEHIGWLPRSESMEVTNDPRFMANSVIAKRLAAFSTLSFVAVLMVNLAVKQMFMLQKDIHLNTAKGWVQYIGFLIMTLVFLMDLFSVIVVVQQLFMTYRLLTAGATGFEVAKSFYLESNIVSLRHLAVKGFLFSLPLFVASTGCMLFVVFANSGVLYLAIPPFIMLAIGAIVLTVVNMRHSSVFKDRYAMAKAHEQPLLSHVNTVVSRSSQGPFTALDA